MHSEKLNIFNRRHLKIIASITMFIDHITACTTTQMNYEQVNRIFQFIINHEFMLRSIGRIAFPLYSFLFVESWLKTSNKKKYMLNLLIFALISEPIYDKVFSYGTFNINPGYNNQNIIFIFLFCSIYFYISEFIYNKFKENEKYKFMKYIGFIIMFIPLCYAIVKLAIDYGILGIIPIIVFYILRNKRLWSALSIFITYLFEALYMPAVYATIPMIAFYNDEYIRFGKLEKYFYYVFYPAHLLIIGLVCGAIL